MNALRWILGSIAVLLGGGFVGLALLGNAFRKSFGASEHSPILLGLPVAGVLLLLSALLFPANKPLLHVAAVSALGLLASCLWQICREGATALWFAVAYLTTWFGYYGLAVWRAAPQP
jgi:hypothetical protein